MNRSFSTIDEYLLGFAAEQQQIVQALRAIIRKAAPEATESINQRMPTFRFNGNLIQYALFKQHICIYPGSAAIQAFQGQLGNYASRKGSIQIPLDQPLPEKLIQQLLQYNLERLKLKQVHNWSANQYKWTVLAGKIKQLVEQTTLTKTTKWGTDVYTYQGKNVLSFAGFKNHFALWFYNGVFMQDKLAVLITASPGKTKSLRQWRFLPEEEINEKQIRQYIQEAIIIAQEGKVLKNKKIKPNAPVGLLKERLAADSAFENAFEKLSPAKKQDYISYMDEAKQEATKQRRMEKIYPLIMEGNGLNNKFKK